MKSWVLCTDQKELFEIYEPQFKLPQKKRQTPTYVIFFFITEILYAVKNISVASQLITGYHPMKYFFN
jgi:hypothetical protein